MDDDYVGELLKEIREEIAVLDEASNKLNEVRTLLLSANEKINALTEWTYL